MASVTVSVNLTMDAAVAARVVAAMRGLFPDIATQGLTDRQAAGAVFRWQARMWTRQWEAMQAANPDAAAQQAVDAAHAAQRAAADQADADTESITLT